MWFEFMYKRALSAEFRVWLTAVDRRVRDGNDGRDLTRTCHA